MYNQGELERAIIHHLLNGDRRNIPLLENIRPEMFKDRTCMQIFPHVKYENLNTFEIRDKTGLKLSDIVDLQTDFLPPLGESSIQKMIDSYYLHRSKQAIAAATDMTQLYESINEFMTKRVKPQDSGDVIRSYEKYVKEHRKLASSGMIGLSTGWPSVDKITMGMAPGHIWVAGGRYGSGKSFFGINVANSVLEQNGRVAIFSLEMSTNEYIQRLISLRSGVGYLQVISELEGEEEEKRNTAQEEVLMSVDGENLTIFDNVFDVEQIGYKIRALKEKNGLNLAVIDYIQLISGPGSFYENISSAVNKLQRIALETGVTLLLISQLNNQTLQSKSYATMGSDGFKGAGEISQVANVAVIIEREKNSDGEMTPLFMLNFTKIRHGFGRLLGFKINFPGGQILDPAVKPEVRKEVLKMQDEVNKLRQKQVDENDD